MADYYTDSNVPSTGSALTSAVMRAEFDLISAGFAKIAGYTGNGGKIVAINAGGTAQEALSTTGSGNVVMATSPTLVTPILGTPTSGTLTNCTGLPVSSGIAGLGTGVATALAVNVGSAGAPVLFNGAGGTPTSLVGTNITGTAAGLTAGTATTANRTDSGEVTVTAHATTGDIFAAAANSILWDDSGGAITCTIFPNASKAGMTRELRCNGATKFTAGANLLIDGVASGTTVTLVDGAIVKVRAITTSQFRMSYFASGTYTAAGQGFTTDPVNVTGIYKIEDGMVEIDLPSISGTSNATTFFITGAPSCCISQSSCTIGGISTKNNGVQGIGSFQVSVGSAQISLYPGVAYSSWTNSGTKGIPDSTGSRRTSFRYPIA